MRSARKVGLASLDWPALLRAGDLLVWGQAGAEPLGLTGALVSVGEALPPCEAFIGIGWSQTAAALARHMRFVSYCGTGTNRKLGDRLGILPTPYSRLAPSLARRAPVLLLQLAPGLRPGEYSLGLAHEYLADLLPHARLVVGEVNPHVPRTAGSTTVPAGVMDLIVEHDDALPPLLAPPAGESDAEAAIGARVAALVPDGATLQIGLGGIPRAVLRALGHHRGLGIHSGLITDDVVDLHERGVVTNEAKPFDTGQTVAGLLAGGERLNRWAHDNPALAMRPTSHTHDFAKLAALPRLVAINSAIEVDLTGQVNAEVAAGRYVGAVGGAGDFLRGAQASAGGLPVIALPAAAGANSRIVARLGGPVSTARADVGLVVTEHGIADLRGLDLAERQRRMLAIAAPEHQDALARTIFESQTA